MDIIIWFEEGDAGEVLASAVSPRGSETLAELLYAKELVYVVGLRGTPREFLKEVKGRVEIVIYKDGKFTPFAADNKVLQ